MGKQRTWLAGAAETEVFIFLTLGKMELGRGCCLADLLSEGLDPNKNVYLGFGFPFKSFLLPNDLGWLSPIFFHSPWAWQGNLEGTKSPLPHKQDLIQIQRISHSRLELLRH